MVGPDMQDIQTEIMTNGPVEAGFYVYSDFSTYSGGIYQKSDSSDNYYLGQHAIKVLGWGIENNVPYWLCANSWSSDWGEKGFFRILRGSDECGIEACVAAGMAGKPTKKTTRNDKFQSYNTENNQDVVNERLQPKKPHNAGNMAPPYPSFPPQFTCNFTLVISEGPVLNGSWYFDYPNNRQRMDYDQLGHSFTTIYQYDKAAAYYYYGLFDSFVCFAQPIPSPSLPPGVPNNATFTGNSSCPQKCSVWLQYFSYDVLSFYVSIAPPTILLGLGVGTSPFDMYSLEFWDYKFVAPDPSVFEVPNGPKSTTTCLAWPGPNQSPPPK